MAPPQFLYSLMNIFSFILIAFTIVIVPLTIWALWRYKMPWLLRQYFIAIMALFSLQAWNAYLRISGGKWAPDSIYYYAFLFLFSAWFILSAVLWIRYAHRQKQQATALPPQS